MADDGGGGGIVCHGRSWIFEETFLLFLRDF